MRFTLCSIAAATAAAIALTSCPPASAANVALMLNGIGGGADLPDLVMSNVLGGRFGSYQRQNVSWPQQASPVTGRNGLSLSESITVGADNLEAAVSDALTRIGPKEHVTVVGLSAGALVADELLRRLADDPDAPDKSKLNFVVVSDSSRIPFNRNRFDPNLRYTYSVPIDSVYNTIVVASQYDGFADFPDRQTNIVAVANAIAGQLVLHVPSMFADLSKVPAAQVSLSTNARGGKTTTYFLVSNRLPLVQLFPGLGKIEATLKGIVDAGYVRNDGKSAAAKSAAAAPVEPSEISVGATAAELAVGETETDGPPETAVQPAATLEPDAASLDAMLADSTVDSADEDGRDMPRRTQFGAAVQDLRSTAPSADRPSAARPSRAGGRSQ